MTYACGTCGKPEAGLWYERCRCVGSVGPNPQCPIHGNHPSSIEPEFDPGENDNTRGPASAPGESE